MKFPVSLTLAVATFLAAGANEARAQKSDPCCTIVSLDTKTGLVRVKDRLGATFTVRLATAEPASLLEVGQAVDLDRAKKVLVLRRNDAEPASIRLTEISVSTEKSSASPCCSIVAVDARSGIVTARETASGYTFRFKADKRVLGSLKVGDKVFADLTKKTVRLKVNDIEPCCGIIN